MTLHPTKNLQKSILALIVGYLGTALLLSIPSLQFLQNNQLYIFGNTIITIATLMFCFRMKQTDSQAQASYDLTTAYWSVGLIFFLLSNFIVRIVRGGQYFPVAFTLDAAVSALILTHLVYHRKTSKGYNAQELFSALSLPSATLQSIVIFNAKLLSATACVIFALLEVTKIAGIADNQLWFTPVYLGSILFTQVYMRNLQSRVTKLYWNDKLLLLLAALKFFVWIGIVISLGILYKITGQSQVMLLWFILYVAVVFLHYRQSTIKCNNDDIFSHSSKKVS